MYRNWWRVQAVGVHNVPADGRAMRVSNHAGVVPYDGAMVPTALLLEHEQPRHARAPVLDGFFTLPVASWLMRRTGNTLAHQADALRLLETDELVLVVPEGAGGAEERSDADDPGRMLAIAYRVRDVIQAGL